MGRERLRSRGGTRVFDQGLARARSPTGVAPARTVLMMFVAGVALSSGLAGRAVATGDASREKQGAAIAPFPLPKGKVQVARAPGELHRQLAGLQRLPHLSIVRAGTHPFDGGDGAFNTTNYLAGGVPFGELHSESITRTRTACRRA